MSNGKHDQVPTGEKQTSLLQDSDNEMDSEALVSISYRSVSLVGEWCRPYKVAMIVGVTWMAIVALIAYASKPAVASESVKGVALSFNTNGIIQKSSTPTHTCPSGYGPSHMDMMNHDADMHEETLSKDKCAEKCDKDDTCRGFEFNIEAAHCWITRAGHHCTSKQHMGWVSCVKANHTCPNGYSVTDLDMQNHDADMKEESLSADKCAEHCDEDDECKGFEFNEDAKHCWITREAHACTENQHEGWVGCIRIDTA